MADDDVRFDWDQANAEHIARHSIKPGEAEQAIRNDPLDMNYEVSDGEERWTALWHTDEYRVLLVVRTCGPTLYGSSSHGLLEGERETLICVPRDC